MSSKEAIEKLGNGDQMTDWMCVQCGQRIESVEHGWLEWIEDPETGRCSVPRVVHHKEYSPLETCYAPWEFEPGLRDGPLSWYVGEQGLERLNEMHKKGGFDEEGLNAIIELIHGPGYKKLYDLSW